MALARKNRLIRKKDFESVFSFGESVFVKYIQVRVLKTDNNLRRFGFIVPSKFLKKAVDRNRFKRQISEGIRENIELFPKSIDLVIILKSKPDNSEIKDLISGILEKIK